MPYTLHSIRSDRGIVDLSRISLVCGYENPYGHIEYVTLVGNEPTVYLTDLMNAATTLEVFLNQHDERLSRSAIYRTLKDLQLHRDISHRMGE